jgi:methylenetetrahydrofolate dehydrogenase (NADP+) / methenyltetrahydrofolate cyclohydrolase
MLNLIDGKILAEQIKDKLALEISKLKSRRPHLAIILAGSREDSQLYVSLKEREAKKLGIDTSLYKLTEFEGEKEILELINFLNKDTEIDGILVQLPLPAKFDTDQIISAIDPAKDVDGFCPNHPSDVDSPVFLATAECFKYCGLDLTDKKICLLYNSDIFGQDFQKFLEKLGAQVEIIPAKDIDNNLSHITRSADILISALGRPKFITAELIKDQAVLIDIGITKVDGKVVGDVDLESTKNKASYISPVPGGIGPLTIAFLFKNVLTVYRRNF